MEVTRFSEMFLSYHNTKQCHNSEDFDLKLCRESLKSPFMLIATGSTIHFHHAVTNCNTVWAHESSFSFLLSLILQACKFEACCQYQLPCSRNQTCKWSFWKRGM